MGGLNAGLGAMKSSQNRRQRKMEAEARAAEIEASPWTGRAATTQVATPSPSIWADMLGGAVSGIGQAQALQNAGLFSSGGGEMGASLMSPGASQSYNYFQGEAPSMWNRMIPGQPTLMGR
jgi:hypothetical protein